MKALVIATSLGADTCVHYASHWPCASTAYKFMHVNKHLCTEYTCVYVHVHIELLYIPSSILYFSNYRGVKMLKGPLNLHQVTSYKYFAKFCCLSGQKHCPAPPKFLLLF